MGIVLAFGAGALVSAVSFDLAEEGLKIGSGAAVGGGLAVGALTYFGLDRLVERRASGGGAGPALALGALPRRASPSRRCSASGWPPARASASACWRPSSCRTCPRRSARPARCARPGAARPRSGGCGSPSPLVCTLASVAGYAIADTASGDFKAAINGFAAGALLVMLIDSMIPEAARKAGDVAGLVTVLGFAVATALLGVVPSHVVHPGLLAG